MAGGGKKGGAKVQVTEYYMSQHFGVCAPVDAIKSIIIKEKEAWSGYVSAQTTISINQPELFGGNKKEGGAVGTVYVLPGRPDQVLADELAVRLGRADGEDTPGFRGLTSLFFVGGDPRSTLAESFFGGWITGSGNGEAGFYWSANNPYLPGVWVEVERAPVGLTVAYALIPRPGTNFFPYDQVDNAIVSGGREINERAGWLIKWSNGDAQTIEWWELATKTLIGSTNQASIANGTVVNVDLADDGTAYFVGLNSSFARALWTVPLMGSETITLASGAAGGLVYGPTRVFDVGGDRYVFTGKDASTGYLSYGDNVAATGRARDFCLKSDDTVWGLFQPSGSSDQTTLRQLVGGSAEFTFTGVTRAGPGDPGFCHNHRESQFTVFTDGKWYAIDDTTGAIKASGNFTGPLNNLPRKNPWADSFWSSYTEYSITGAAAIRSVAPFDWVNEDTHTDPTYDRTNHAIWAHGQFTDHETIRLLDRGDRDANPAHIVFEALTNTDWGMGSPTSLIDVDSFEDAGVVLYDEPLGISMIWTRQASIQDFIQEVLDHAQAVLYVDPRTGLLTFKLIRDDYVVADLPTINPSNADLTNFGRKLWGEIVNEITVTWTNPETEQDETVTVHDLASIATQGGIVSDGRNYYGVRYAALAQRLAARDLRSAGAPLASCEAEVDRTQWDLRPASVIKVDWPEYGLEGVVMRVTSIDYGRPGDPTIKLSLMEDVFGLDAGDYVDPPATVWEDPSEPPEAMTEQVAFTLPYYFVVNAGTDVSGAVYPEVLAGILATSDSTDSLSYELWGETTLPDGSSGWEALATNNIIGHAELVSDLPAEAISLDVEMDNPMGKTRPVASGFAIIGDGPDEEGEITLITEVSGQVSMLRGVLDTVPREWPAGTGVWFVDEFTALSDPTVRAVGEEVNYRLRTRTSQGLLGLLSAPILTYEMIERPWLPSRPADVDIEGIQFNDALTPVDMIGRADPWVTVTWANRNRLTEDGQVLAWTDATVTPETGQTTTITVYAVDGTTVLATHAGLTGTSFDVPDASFGVEDVVLIVPTSSRTDSDGTFESLQGHGIYVRVSTSNLQLSGDMADGDDVLLLSGDMTDGNDRLVLSGTF